MARESFNSATEIRSIRSASRRDHASPETESSSKRPWILLPREHGAYAELIFPLITALALGSVSRSQLLLTFAAVAMFLAHESVLVILGERGNRARAQLRARAACGAAILLVSAFVAAALGLWQAPAGTIRAALIPLFPMVLLAPLIISHREKTVAGEILIALVFSTALIPVALAGGGAFSVAAVAGVVWFAIFFIQTLTVRAVKAHINPNAGANSLARAIIVLSLAVMIAAILLVFTHGPSIVPLAAISPAAFVGVACVWLRVHPRHLRTLGWALVTCDLIALILLVAGMV